LSSHQTGRRFSLPGLAPCPVCVTPQRCFMMRNDCNSNLTRPCPLLRIHSALHIPSHDMFQGIEHKLQRLRHANTLAVVPERASHVQGSNLREIGQTMLCFTFIIFSTVAVHAYRMFVLCASPGLYVYVVPDRRSLYLPVLPRRDTHVGTMRKPRFNLPRNIRYQQIGYQ
jgi:hypothetical protein